ncbi:hypothetical protein HOD19_04570 [bacterium]|jgi:hypothetical protein|nr:hypothetical protein [bacterium]MBT4649018.1 hypothetical protein [bacterium]
MFFKTKTKTAKLLFLCLFTLVFLVAPLAEAASLYVSPSSGNYGIGDSFTVGVYTNSSDQALNAVSGTLSFPTDKIEVTSVSKAGSIMSLWVSEPSFSNSAGTVSFEGIVLNPGYSGSAGKILSVTFHTKGGGSVPVNFATGSILANDGQGTNILTGFGSGNFIIELEDVTPVAPESDTPSAVTGTPSAPQINSITHANPDNWYSATDAEFSWTIPRGVTASSLLIGKKPQAVPAVNYSPAIGYKKITDLDDGTWFFHVRLRSTAGWGGVTHFRLQIDTKDPEYFEITKQPEDDATNPKITFLFEAEDELSGISHYAVKIDDAEEQIWQDDGTHIYTTPALPAGKHTMIVRAIDFAGNELANFAEFDIEPLSAPVITEYPKVIDDWSDLLIKGSTYPNSQVVIWLQGSDDEIINYFTQSDDDGAFSFVAEEELDEGKYQFWAEAIDSRGARSLPSDKFKVEIQKPAFWRIGSMAINILSIIIPLVALVFLLIFLSMFSWNKVRVLRKRVSREADEASAVLKKSFADLRKSLIVNIASLEKAGTKRKLTAAEARVARQLKKDLNMTEKIIRKEIKDIQKEVE